MNVDVLRQIEAAKAGKKLPVVEQLGLRRMFPQLETANLAFRNLGNLKFADVSAEWGFNAAAISQGMALADLDNDGDLDVVINNLNAPAMIYRNETVAPRFAVRLRGNLPNTRGIGAKITVTGGPVPQSQEMICGGRYLSSDDPVRVFAAGSLTKQLRIEVVWRSGKRSVVPDAKPNSLYEIDEAEAIGEQNPASRPGTSPRFFEEITRVLSHRHTEEPFDDFARQPMLPNKLSQLGPGVSWFDVDGDGWDDLIIGSGRGGVLGVFHNEKGSQFKRLEGAPYNQPVTRDQTTVLGWRNSAGHAVLLAGSSNYEDGLASWQRHSRIQSGEQNNREFISRSRRQHRPARDGGH
jgi:hypothetical protein